MSEQSNNSGRAYEYIFLIELNDAIRKLRCAEIERNSAFYAARNAWTRTDPALQNNLIRSAKAAVTAIFDMEPMITEQGEDLLMLKIQTDSEGKEGDVRDIVLSRKDVLWEIGLSLKHNHFAVKHSRLARSLDFGQKWFGMPCSDEYWMDVKPVFDYLSELEKGDTDWEDLSDKEDDVYVPLLRAFMDEVMRSSGLNTDIPKRMVEYLLGKFDFYKVISIDSRRVTQIETYNMRGKLNRASKKAKPKILVPAVYLPTRIVSIDFKPGSKNTAELYMDGGWQFSFRIHNASKKVETSLKFDIRIVGMPTAILILNCIWN